MLRFDTTQLKDDMDASSMVSDISRVLYIAEMCARETTMEMGTHLEDHNEEYFAILFGSAELVGACARALDHLCVNGLIKGNVS